ncbi:MAG TPA: hypothetical protein VHD84_02580 [Candidatus Saccharimonadales bacterium]|nr:hypothetical protein [Candidatus Saccharimonadales bacterium]
MHERFGVSVSTKEVGSRGEAEELIRKLAELGLDAQVQIRSTLLDIEPERLPELSEVNFREFTELMAQVGKDQQRAHQLWTALRKTQRFMRVFPEPLYEIDEKAILAQATDDRERSKYRKRISQEQAKSYGALDFAAIVASIRNGSLENAAGFGANRIEELTEVTNQWIKTVLEQDGQDGQDVDRVTRAA